MPLAFAATLIPLGAGLLVFRATEWSDVCRWTDPIFWIAVVSGRFQVREDRLPSG